MKEPTFEQAYEKLEKTVRTLEAGDVFDIRIFAVSYDPVSFLSFTQPSVITTIPITQIFDRTYENP